MPKKPRLDATLKLRLGIWVLILGLWGVMLYQFLGEEDEQSAAMSDVAHILPWPAPPSPPAGGAVPEPSPAGQPQAALPTDAELKAPLGEDTHFIKPIPPEFEPSAAPQAKSPQPRPYVRREMPFKLKEPPIPAGFTKTASRHFLVYFESDPAPESLLHLVENLHGNLMLDLSPFSPWANDEKVSLFGFRSQDTYHKVTGRPPWSGGASSVAKRKIYFYESPELTGILAHELCHIYYDGFYLGRTPDPLWLSEGMATLEQVERGLAAPLWLKQNMEILRHHGGFSLADLVKVEATANASDDEVRLWYTQSYSVVRFLTRLESRSAFYRFSAYLREGKPMTEALYRAYGMPFTGIKALEYAWRYEVSQGLRPRQMIGR